MSIPFTQYLMPDGKKVNVTVKRPLDIEIMADQFLRHFNGKFEIELLQTGDVSMTTSEYIDGEWEDMDGEVVPNGPGVPDAVDRLVRKMAERKGIKVSTA